MAFAEISGARAEWQETYDPHKSTTEVRAGDKRQMNTRVLFMLVIAIIVTFVIIYFVFFPKYPTG